jgi:hypothetical protein
MNNLESFQEALNKDLSVLHEVQIKTLSAKEVYLPLIKMLGLIYLLLCGIAISLVVLLQLIGLDVNRTLLWDIVAEALICNLMPLVFMTIGFSSPFILWVSIRTHLSSALFIEDLMKHYFKFYCLIYGLFIGIPILLRFKDLEWILMCADIFSMCLFILFASMEIQRLGQGILFQKMGELLSLIKSQREQA